MAQQRKTSRIKTIFMRLLRRNIQKLVVSHPRILLGLSFLGCWSPLQGWYLHVHSMSHILTLDPKGFQLLQEVSNHKRSEGLSPKPCLSESLQGCSTGMWHRPCDQRGFLNFPPWDFIL